MQENGKLFSFLVIAGLFLSSTAFIFKPDRAAIYQTGEKYHNDTVVNSVSLGLLGPNSHVSLRENPDSPHFMDIESSGQQRFERCSCISHRKVGSKLQKNKSKL